MLNNQKKHWLTWSGVLQLLIMLTLFCWPWQWQVLLSRQPFLLGLDSANWGFFWSFSEFWMVAAILFYAVGLIIGKFENLNWPKQLVFFQIALVTLIIHLLAFSLYWDNTSVAVLTAMRYIIYLLFFVVVVVNAPLLQKSRNFFLLIVGVQILLTLFQFTWQRNLGLFGESTLGVEVLNVAKLQLGDATMVRPLGGFAHANLLAAFYLFSLIVLDSFGQFKRQFWSWFWKVLLILMILLTFSRAAILATALFLLLQLGVSRKKLSLIHLAVSLLVVVLGLFLIDALVPLWSRFTNFNFADLLIRQNFLQDALLILEKQPLGIGPGQYLGFADLVNSQIMQPWQNQPVHNIFVLAAVEFGWLGGIIWLLMLVAGLVYFPYQQAQKSQNTILLIFGIVSLLSIGLLDHYLLTLWQGQLLWLFLAVFLGISLVKKSPVTK